MLGVVIMIRALCWMVEYWQNGVGGRSKGGFGDTGGVVHR